MTKQQQAQPTSRQARVDQMVADGWSREFAEAYVPMSVAQARREGRAVQGYVSELSLLARRAR